MKVKYLGIFIDSHLRWDHQITYICQKIRNLLAIFKHLRNILNMKDLQILYHALVESHLTYGIVAWGGAGNTHIHRLQVLQKWILKIIHARVRTYPTETLFRESSVLDIKQLFCRDLLITQYTHRARLSQRNHPYETRNKKNVQLPKPVRTHTQHSFYYLGPKLYNMIPLELRTTSSIYVFKKQIRLWVIMKGRSFADTVLNSRIYTVR